MNFNIRKYLATAAIGMLLAMPSMPLNAQDYIEIEPLFEYPVAPETLESITDKSNYLVEHFWDQMDFKTGAIVDQTALNDAMRVYEVPFRWADKDKVYNSVDKLISKISKTPSYMIQFTKAAEETMYGPRAETWIDEVYLKFLNAIIANKKVPGKRKTRYEQQLATIQNSMTGKVAQSFSFTDRYGEKKNYFPMTTVSIMIFGDPTDTDWRMTRLRMETNLKLRQAIDKGQISIHYILPKEVPNWEKEVANYPEKWVVGYSPEITDKYDLRFSPSIYLIGTDGKIIKKNIPLDAAITEALMEVEK